MQLSFSTGSTRNLDRNRPQQWLTVGVLCLAAHVFSPSSANATSCTLPNNPDYGSDLRAGAGIVNELRLTLSDT